ncbi:MAG: AAA family ATPase, partial [Candidatus Heimdallarchaeota archaeon]|nr:AAA family ATPase [Candidatus Heimdallarchaeota archaeon]
GRTYRIAPSTGIFYWSAEILGILEDLLERNMAELFSNPEIQKRFAFLLNWFSPSESGVRNENHAQKIYDLRVFAESSFGYPLLLNYTWHDIFHHIQNKDNADKDKFKLSKRYWTDHFNYMDFGPWHQYLGEGDTNASQDLLEGLKRQLLIKINRIDSLRIHFQTKGRNLISNQSYPIKSSNMNFRFLPLNYNKISHVWLAFSRLKGNQDELAADYFRHIFPLFSIAKLAAAEVSNLEVSSVRGPKGGISFEYKFKLKGLSSNVKMNEGSRFILVPAEMRDYNQIKKWKISIKNYRWNENENCFTVFTNPEPKVNFFEEDDGTKIPQSYVDFFSEYTKLDTSKQWYIYPISQDYWSNRLYNLLRSTGLGDSWIGKRLSYLWSLSTEIEVPKSTSARLNELYMFYPDYFKGLKTSSESQLLSNLILEPNQSQKKAILNSVNSVISGIQGPPGTGKSQTIAILVNELILRADKSKKSIRILITAFSYQALNVVAEKIATLKGKDGQTQAKEIEKIFVRSGTREKSKYTRDLTFARGTWKLDGQSRVVTSSKSLEESLSGNYIVFGTPHQIYHLSDVKIKNGKKVRCFKADFHFDVIIVDEASQLPLDQFIPSLAFIKSPKIELDSTSFTIAGNQEETSDISNPQFNLNIDPQNMTQVIIVGDQHQLPPVQTLEPPKKLKNILGSLFSYYVEHHKLEPIQLEVNYRSHKHIVGFTKRLGLYSNLVPSDNMANQTLQGNIEEIKDNWIKEILNPNRVVASIVHNEKYETAISKIEAYVAERLILSYFNMIEPSTREEEIKFWTEKVGIVAPHNAQSRLIIQNIFMFMIANNLSQLNEDELMEGLRGTIFSVEKFQGSDRDLIIGTIGISSKDQLRAEEEFIYELNRFNVLTSRAKSKVILICSQNFLKYFPMKREVMENSSKIKDYVENYCDTSIAFDLDISHLGRKSIEFRYFAG